MSQSQIAIDQGVGRPLTTLSEDEQMFRMSVREFAEGEVAPTLWRKWMRTESSIRTLSNSVSNWA